MQTRLSFNGGEVDEGVALRQDMEVAGRRALVVENWEVEEAGGLRRRRGLKRVLASEAGARLLGYTYSYVPRDGVRFVVEVTARRMRVIGVGGGVVATLDAVGMLGHELDPEGCRAIQVNALLIVTSLKHAPCVLKWDGGSEWSLEDFEFKNLAWRDDEDKDGHVVLESGVSGGIGVELVDGAGGDEG